ncbi:MAG: glycosyltransferase family A protein [Bacteroidota bacterium]
MKSAIFGFMRVVVVIPCFNVEGYVGDAIESALQQTYPTAEVIAVDNNSTDGTAAVLATYQDRYPQRFRWLREERQNASAARNTGWQASTADWYQFLDADDILHSEKIEQQLALAQEQEALWVIGSPLYRHLDGTELALIPWEDPWQGLAHGMYVGQTSANLYTHKLLTQVRGWDANLPFTQDVDLAFRMLQMDASYVLDHIPSCTVRDRPSGKLSQMAPAGILKQHLYLRNKINRYLQEKRPTYWSEYQLFFQLALYRYLRMLAVHDPHLAGTLFEQYLPPRFKVQPNTELGLPSWDAQGVNLLGVKKFAQSKNALKKLVPTVQWQQLKGFLYSKKKPIAPSQTS